MIGGYQVLGKKNSFFTVCYSSEFFRLYSAGRNFCVSLHDLSEGEKIINAFISVTTWLRVRSPVNRKLITGGRQFSSSHSAA